MRLKINNFENRKSMVLAAATEGYKVWIEEKRRSGLDTDYYVNIETQKTKTDNEDTHQAGIPHC